MKYLKTLESYQKNESQIIKICEEIGISNYVINSNQSNGITEFTVDVLGSVDLSLLSLKKLPLKFNRVDGTFNCSFNNLTTLEGAPKIVTGSFLCNYNYLTTLEGSPQKVYGLFSCDNNNLTTLKGVTEDLSAFSCVDNQLTNLKYGPKYVNTEYNCSSNKLTTLEGSPDTTGQFNCSFNKLKTLKYASKSTLSFKCNYNKLTTLEGAPVIVYDTFKCTDNENLLTFKGYPKEVIGKSYFNRTPVYEIFKLFENSDMRDSIISALNDLEIIKDDKIYIEGFNDILEDANISLVEYIKGYTNIYY